MNHTHALIGGRLVRIKVLDGVRYCGDAAAHAEKVSLQRQQWRFGMFANEKDAATAAIEQAVDQEAQRLMKSGEAGSEYEAMAKARANVTARRREQNNFSKSFDRFGDGPLSS